MPGKVIRFRDYERRSREPDAVQRDPAEECVIIVLPVLVPGRFKKSGGWNGDSDQRSA